MSNFWLEYNQNGDVQEFTFEGSSVTIGRDKSSDFVLDHPTVSRQHAVIRRDGPGRFKLRVLSRGGLTALDGHQVQGEVPLHDGANINLGKLTFRFRSDDAPQQPQHNLGPSGGSHSSGQGPSSSGAFGAGGQGSQGQSSGAGGSGQSGFGGGSGSGGSGQGGFGGSGGGFNSGSSNSGFSPEKNESGGMGAFAQSSQGFQAGMQGQSGMQPGQGQQGGQGGGAQGQGHGQDGSVDAGEEKAEKVDIISWDEIASSEEAMSEEETENRAKSVFERMEEGQKKQEETRPGLVIVAGIAIVGLLGYVFFGGGAGGGVGGGDEEEIAPEELQVEVECLGKADCIKKAKNAYNVGNETLKKSGAAVSNRFEGYKSLLEAEKYLEEAGVSEPPPSMNKLPERKQAAKQQLDKLFRNFRVAYHQAKNSKNYTQMAESLDTIQSYFPDKKSYQYRWAQSKIRKMKQNGTYPKKGY
jgi:hypothetical protein